MALTKQFYAMFIILYVGYIGIVYLRQTVSYASPVLMEEEEIQNSDLGMIVTSQMLGYSIMKLVGGTLVDSVNPGYLYACSLGLSGLIGFLFTYMSSVPLYAFLWFLIGLVLGPSWGAAGVLIKKNSPPDQLATWWSVLSTSLNVAGTFGPFISTVIISFYNWRTTLIVGGSLNIGLAVFCFFFFTKSTSFSEKKEDAKKSKEPEVHVSALFNPVMISLCISYLLVSVSRGACNSWGQLYLIQSKRQSLQTGSSFTSGQEVGGIIGSFVAGYVSDIFIAKRPGNVMPRLVLIGVLLIVQTVGVLLFLFSVSMHSSKLWIAFLSFVIGFGIYGAVALLGVTSMEVSPDKLAGTAHSMASLGSNIGQVMAGYPLSVIATWHSWHEAFLIVLLVSIVSILNSFLTMRLYQQKLLHSDKEKLS